MTVRFPNTALYLRVRGERRRWVAREQATNFLNVAVAGWWAMRYGAILEE